MFRWTEPGTSVRYAATATRGVRKVHRVGRRIVVGLVLSVVLIAAAAGVGAYLAVRDAAEQMPARIADAVTPDLPSVVDMRDRAAEVVDSLPPPSLIVQYARELVEVGR